MSLDRETGQKRNWIRVWARLRLTAENTIKKDSVSDLSSKTIDIKNNNNVFQGKRSNAYLLINSWQFSFLTTINHSQHIRYGCLSYSIRRSEYLEF